MPLWRIATAPDELDTADIIPDPASSVTPSVSSANLHQRTTTTSATSTDPSTFSSPPLDTSYAPTGPFLVKTSPPPDTNKNTSWFLYPGVWTMYFFIVLLAWLLILSLLGCSAGTAWTIVNVIHFVVTFYLFHWKKGSPFAEDQGVYDKLTWWEQVDDGRQFTRTRKFLTAVPLILYLITTYTVRDSEYLGAVLLLNTVVVFVLLIAKLPILHQVRIFGINADYPT